MTGDWNYLEASSFICLTPLLVGIKGWAQLGLLTRSSIRGLFLVTEFREKKNSKKNNLESEHYKRKN